jgi:UPF0755 protein
MKAFARIAVAFLALVALVVGFAGGTAALDIYQPTNSKVTALVQFQVMTGDTTNSVAQRLQDDGLIRNALVFRLWARYKHLDRGIEQGVYLLSPSMSMDQIIAQLQQATPDEIAITIPDGYRATQYPQFFTQLNKFDANQFLTIVKTGIEPDGTKLWQKYWYVEQPSPKVFDALEGYLYPAGYYFYPNATATDVIEKLLDQFGMELCPGPTSTPKAYIYDSKLCRQNAQTINGKNIFDLMRAAYPDTKTDTDALHDALIISSLAAREIKAYKDVPGVAAVYHNRYLHNLDQNKYPSDTGLTFGSDPSVEYARDNEHPPTDGGKWWAALNDSGNNIAKTNPYNLYTQPGMPPGPIANPYWDEIKAGIAPANSPYWYFVSNKCGTILYAKDLAGFSQIESQMNGGNC